MLPSTVDRVPNQTAQHINEQIRRQTDKNIARVANSGRQAIQQRLAELDREWDIERQLEANAASVVLISSLLGFTVNRKFLIMPAIVGAFLLQHAVQGWCPPLPILRRLGVRTTSEIERERDALKNAL